MTFEGIEITWYGYVIAGFCLGTYIHSPRIRHWLHLLVAKMLSGFIWILRKTDCYYKAPKTIIPKTDFTSSDLVSPIRGGRKDGIEVGEEELDRWLSKNPELSVAQR